MASSAVTRSPSSFTQGAAGGEADKDGGRSSIRLR
jgi:hypothetical protein